MTSMFNPSRESMLHSALFSTESQAMYLKHHASTLNNIGAVLYKANENFEALNKFQEAVGVLQTGRFANVADSHTSSSNEDVVVNRITMEKTRELLVSLKQEEIKGCDDTTTEPPRKKTRRSMGTSRYEVIESCKIRQVTGVFPQKLFRRRDQNGNCLNKNNREYPPPLSNGEALEIDLECRDANAMLSVDSGTPFDVSRCEEVILFNLALVQYRMGCIEAAMELFSFSKSLDPSRKDTVKQKDSSSVDDGLALACLNNMAEICLQERQVKDATKLLSHALCLGIDALTAKGFSGVVHSLFGKDVGNDADKKPSKQIHGSKPPSGDQSSLLKDNVALTFCNHMATTISNLAQARFLQQDFVQALQLTHDSLKLRRLCNPRNTDNLHQSIAYYNIGLIHFQNQDLHVALNNFRYSIKLSSMHLGNDKHLCPFYASTLHEIGTLLYRLHRWNESMSYLSKSLAIRNRIFGSDHECVGASLHAIGNLFYDMEEYSDALNVYERALKVQTIAHGSDALETVTVLCDMGRTHHMIGELEESLSAYQEVIRIARKLFGHTHEYVARILNIIGNIRVERGEVAKAMPAFDEALRIHLAISNMQGGSKKEEDPALFEVVKNTLCNVQIDHEKMAAMA